MKRGCRLAILLTCVGAGITCGSSSSLTTPGSLTSTGGTGTSGACRTFATSATEVSTSDVGPSVNGAMVTGSFATSTGQFTSTVVYPNGSLCTTAVFTYATTADFVNEVTVVPPLVLATAEMTTVGPACGAGSGTSSQTYSYDSQRRLTSITQGSATTSFIAWDGAGRPTGGTKSSGATVLYVYDDTARTVTITTASPGAQSVSTLTYDGNGTLIQQVDRQGASRTTATWTVGSTDKVCK